MENLIRYRAFKVDVMPATNTKPERVKVTDLRFDKSIVLGYHFNATHAKETAIEYLAKLGIDVVAEAWAETKNVFNCTYLLTTDFNIQLKKIDE